MKNTKKGFTLVELIIVIAVMAILVAIAIPTVGNVVENARKTTNDSNAATMESGLKTKAAEYSALFQKGNQEFEWVENTEDTDFKQIDTDGVEIDGNDIGDTTVAHNSLEDAIDDLKLTVKSRTFYYDANDEKVYVIDGKERNSFEEEDDGDKVGIELDYNSLGNKDKGVYEIIFDKDGDVTVARIAGTTDTGAGAKVDANQKYTLGKEHKEPTT